MRIYVVGGAVRDQLLGRPVVDRDYVVVGATPEEMLAAGYLPVGKDFPVFLHPTTREEYALARTERKTAPGYGGFVFHTDPQVTLEEDLQRRDLTINAMAQTLDGAVLIDPCGGARDLEGRWFRHVGAAFVEDPVRLLRVGRFAARFDDFRTAPETQQLLMQMVANGEVDALVPERVWAEVSRGLMERSPSRMVSLLQGVGALQRIAPMAPSDAETLSALDRIALTEAPLAVRFAVWMVAGKLSVDDISALCAHLKTPVEMREYSVLLASLASSYHEQGEAGPNGVLFVLESSDALRRPERFGSVLKALGQLIGESASSGTSLAMFQARLERGLEVIRTIDNRKVAAAAQGADVAKAIHDARLAALTDALGRSGPGRRS